MIPSITSTFQLDPLDQSNSSITTAHAEYLIKDIANFFSNLQNDPDKISKESAVLNTRVLRTYTESSSSDIMKLTHRMYFNEISKKDNLTPLTRAARSGRTELFEPLKLLGASLDMPDGQGNTPLSEALRRNDAAAIETLYALGANPFVNLLLAVEKKDGLLFNNIFEHLDEIHRELFMEQNACEIISDFIKKDRGSLSIIECLIQKNAFDIDETDENGDSFLIQAIENNPLLIETFIKLGADINWSGSRKTPLTAAIFKLDFNLIEKLILLGANPNKRNGEHTPLIEIVLDYLASGSTLPQKIQMIELLIAMGAKINLSAERMTPLTALISNFPDVQGYTDLEREQMIEFLIAKGANINRADNENDTPLTTAVKRNDKQTIRLLIKHGADINRAPKRGKTPLIQAIRSGNLELVKELLRLGASIENMDGQGFTPLTAAAESFLCYRDSHSLQIINLLLKGIQPKQGADPNKCDGNGLTPLRLLFENEGTNPAAEMALKRLLESHGGDYKQAIGISEAAVLANAFGIVGSSMEFIGKNSGNLTIDQIILQGSFRIGDVINRFNTHLKNFLNTQRTLLTPHLNSFIPEVLFRRSHQLNLIQLAHKIPLIVAGGWSGHQIYSVIFNQQLVICDGSSEAEIYKIDKKVDQEIINNLNKKFSEPVEFYKMIESNFTKTSHSIPVQNQPIGNCATHNIRIAFYIITYLLTQDKDYSEKLLEQFINFSNDQSLEFYQRLCEQEIIKPDLVLLDRIKQMQNQIRSTAASKETLKE